MEILDTHVSRRKCKTYWELSLLSGRINQNNRVVTNHNTTNQDASHKKEKPLISLKHKVWERKILRPDQQELTHEDQKEIKPQNHGVHKAAQSSMGAGHLKMAQEANEAD